VKRLLVLTSATGAGHDTHAQATVAWCARIFGRFDDGVQVTVAHALEDSHAFYRGAVGFYNLIQRHAPWFHHAYYNVIELLDALNPGTVGLGRAHYIALLQKIRPDAILSVHDCLNRGYFELAREVVPGVACATYCPEFEGGYGFSRNWVNPRGDFYFGRTEETVREARRRGAAHTLVAGHWAPPPFYDPDNAETERLRAELQLDPGRFTLLLSTGGSGAQNHRALLRALAPLHTRLQVVALCGHDHAARTHLQEWVARETELTVRCLGFTDRMPALLRLAAAVVARAGATTAGEALLCGCPVIFNGLGGMMPQELPTWRWFRARGLGVAAFTAGGVRDRVVRWLERPNELAEVRERLARLRDGTTPQPALEMLLRM
jgi:processive 1,2-diacylglycerol beta-glucosyltransferase